MDWNDEAIARLRALWDEGHSTAEIGRRMAVSKNAVVGKAHRLNLPARPSPIRRDASGAAPRKLAPKRVSGPTLPPLPAAAEPAMPVGALEIRRPMPILEAPMLDLPTRDLASRAAAPERPVLQPVLRTVILRSRTLTCCWPIGEPGTKSFHFCDSDAVQGKPYCRDHAQQAYVKVRDRRDEAVA